MNQYMINIEWEKVECHICCSNNYQTINLNNLPLVDGQFGYSVHPVICECGLVYLNPRWSKKNYDVFYEFYYDELYRLELKPDYGLAGVIDNMRVIWKRIHNHIDNNLKNILDVGCGSGYGLKYLKDKNPEASIYGIESSPKSCKILQEENKAILITKDFDSNWTANFSDKMELIILRHVVEHMLNPVDALKKIRSVLSQDGYIYLATPDMMNPRVKLRDYNYWWEYWFRSVHPYYYCKETLIKTLELAGLYPLACGDCINEEVWCLATKSKIKSLNWTENDLYSKQLNLLRSNLPQS